jgi:hypothetical protein
MAIAAHAITETKATAKSLASAPAKNHASKTCPKLSYIM